MQKSCEQRADEWATDVKGRMEYLANDYIYHQKCSDNLGLGKMSRMNLNRTMEGLKLTKDVRRTMLRRKHFLRLACI